MLPDQPNSASAFGHLSSRKDGTDYRADLDIARTHVSGHSETGSDGLALDVEEQDQTVLAFTPPARSPAGSIWPTGS
jgi:hypothetical protein